MVFNPDIKIIGLIKIKKLKLIGVKILMFL